MASLSDPLDPLSDSALAALDLVADGPAFTSLNSRLRPVRRTGRGPSGGKLLLKLPRRGSDEARFGPPALAAFAGPAMVRLVGMVETDAGPAQVLQRLVPGERLDTLSRAGNDDRATEILGRLMAALHVPPPAGAGAPPFQTLADVTATLHRPAAAPALAPWSGLLDRARSLCHDLLASPPSPPLLLHGDLHHENVLRHDDGDGGRWIAIDPWGVTGEGAADGAALLQNPDGPAAAHLFGPAALARRLAILAETTGYDRQRLAMWGLVLNAVSLVWHHQDRTPPRAGLAVVDSLARLI
ncbi:MAG: aminoglycoside phosphotransferase family protein [Alphaproteobacteria bacterium]